VAWVTVDRRDNDPAVLLSYVNAALDRIEPAIASRTRPMRLVVDNLELLVNQDCLDALAEVAFRLPDWSQLALASRARPRLPEAVSRQLVEIGAAELAMDEREARALLARAGVRLTDPEVAELLDRTAGWPAGLYLAGVSPPDGALAPDGLLGRLADDAVTFLTRTAVLEELSGPLCDAVLGVSGSEQVLASLAGSDLLVSVDHGNRRYRYHQLLRELLAAELERREPELVPELHRRAAAWYETEGLLELAVEHGQAAGDTDRVTRLVAALAFPAYADGRVETARRWFAWFQDQGKVEDHPQIAILGAQMEALLGNPSSAERWAAAAERGLASSAPDRTLAAGAALLRTFLCRDGMAGLRADATAAWAGLAPDDPWRATALLMEGISHLLDGHAERADPILAHAVEVAGPLRAAPAASAALGERAVIAMERRQWGEAGQLAERAVAVLHDGRLDDYVMAAFVHAVAARAALQLGDAPKARAHLARTIRLRPTLTAAMPHRSVQTLLELARSYLALDDGDGARTILQQAGDIVRQRPSLGVLPGQITELAAALEETGQGGLGASSLTTAELRLLPLLSTHLTLLEIGERLHLSRNTVKTQAISIYRKLGVSSRSQAMQRVGELGLLGT
jgi:LuxR family maltose regulon positive regulatory protein